VASPNCRHHRVVCLKNIQVRMLECGKDSKLMLKNTSQKCGFTHLALLHPVTVKKGKVHPRTGSVQAVWPIGGVEVQRYSFMTSALEGGEGSAPRPCRSLPPRKDPYPLQRRLGGPQGRSGQARKISPAPGFYPRTVQPVASHYTD
jgi:hypothetical protein